MLIKTNANGFNHAIPSDITSASTYQSRRELMRLMATGAAGATLATWASREAVAQTVAKPGKLATLTGGKSSVVGAMTMEKITDYKDATTYNNFYEFGTDKADPAKNAGIEIPFEQAPGDDPGGKDQRHLNADRGGEGPDQPDHAAAGGVFGRMARAHHGNGQAETEQAPQAGHQAGVPVPAPWVGGSVAAGPGHAETIAG